LGMGRWHFLPGLIVAGFGLGMTFAPLQTVAMRNVQPRMAGAASGFINTTRQLGGVIGSAAVGALLQARLGQALPAAADKQVAAMPASVPEQIKDGLRQGFSHLTGGLEVGTGQTGIETGNIPAQFRTVVSNTAKSIFDEGFTNAMRDTLWLPIAVMAVAALTILFVKGGGHARPVGAAAEEGAEPEVPARAAH
ncbi:MAG TPA: MFS transporter, partial [Rugosimonospora sp.]|nr:MFS transporter [Rugosimonospora sp.]